METVAFTSPREKKNGMAEPKRDFPKEVRKKVKLQSDRLYFRSDTNHNLGDKISYAPYLKSPSTLKSGITRDERRDERDLSWRIRNSEPEPTWKRVSDNEFTYEVEITIVRKFRSKDLQEIIPDKILEPVLPTTPSNEESWN